MCRVTAIHLFKTRTLLVALVLLATSCTAQERSSAEPTRETPIAAVEMIEAETAPPPPESSEDARALFEVASDALAEIQHPVSRAGALSNLAIAAAHAGDIALTESLVAQIVDDRFVPGAIASLAFAQARAGLKEQSGTSFDRALDAIAPISSALNQARSQAQVAGWLHAAGQTERAREVLMDGVAAIRESELQPDDEALKVLAAVQADLELFSLATSTQALISDSNARRGASQRIFLAHLAQGDTTAAESLLDSIDSSGAQDFCYLRLAEALGRAGDLQEAERMASSIEGHAHAAIAYAAVAAAHSVAQNAHHADRLFGKAEALRRREPAAPYDPIWVNTEVAIALAKGGRSTQAQPLIDEAYEIAKGISEDYIRPHFVETCAFAQARAGDLARAREMLAREPESSWRNGRGEIMAMLVKSGNIPAAIELAEGSQDLEERVALFGALGAVLANPALREAIPMEPRVVPSSWLRWFFGMPLIE